MKRGSGGVDGQSTEQFHAEWGEQISRLQEELRRGLYRPLPVKRVWIDKLGSTEKRPLGVPAVRDRVVQAGLRHVLEPIFERDFAAQSYGFRPGKSAQQALQRVEELLRGGYCWIVDADLKSYFDTIPQETVFAPLSEQLTGQTAVTFIDGDPAAVAMVITKFLKDNPDTSLKVKTGMLEKMVLNEKAFEQLGNLPSREVLLGQLLGTIAAPLTGFVTVLSDIPRKFLRVLTGIKDTKSN